LPEKLAEPEIESLMAIDPKYGKRKIDWLKINAVEILTHIQQLNFKNELIAYNEDIISSMKMDQTSFPFLDNMTKHLIYSHDQGLKLQIAEFFKALMENAEQRNIMGFKDQFYAVCMNQFAKFFAADHEIDIETMAENLSLEEQDDFIAKATDFNRSLEFSKSAVLEIITKSSQLHSLRFRPFMVRTEMLHSIMKTKKLNSKLLNLQIVRVYKQTIKNKEDSLLRYLNKIGMHELAIDFMQQNGGKKNMMHSLFLDIFSFLTKNPSKKVQKYLMDKRGDVIREFAKKEKIIQQFIDIVDNNDHHH
jgi:hypothetical protein